MTVVKFSILTLLAGGFCTLLGIGMWMGPQETPCNAQTGVTAVAVAGSPAPIKSCWSAPSDAACEKIEFFTAEAKCAAGACESVDCVAPVCESSPCPNGSCVNGPCESGPCEGGKCEGDSCTLASTESSAGPTSTPAHAVVQRLPSPYYVAGPTIGSCESGVCVPGAPCSAATACPPGAPCPPAPTFATTSVYHVAPCAGPECPPSAYASHYGVVPAYVSPAPVVSAYASYREAEPQTSDQPSMEMIEAFMEEREKRYEVQIEALKQRMELMGELMQSQMEAKLETQAATLQAQHQIEMAKLHSEAFVKLAGMEQALREEKALLQLVADGTLTTDSLRAILAKNHANGHGAVAQPVSTAAGCACEKCGCETCKCGQPDASCACSECKCEGCACPGCEQAVSVEAPSCPACKTSACKTSACEKKACEASASTTSACGKNADCKSCDAGSVVSVEACKSCTKSCEACAKACGDCKVADATLECDQLTVSADGKTCTIRLGCSNAKCDAADTIACDGEVCKGRECGPPEASAAIGTVDVPFVCEKDGCEVEFHVTAEAPFLSKIPYLGRLFKNAQGDAATEEKAGPADEAQR